MPRQLPRVAVFPSAEVARPAVGSVSAGCDGDACICLAGTIAMFPFSACARRFFVFSGSVPHPCWFLLGNTPRRMFADTRRNLPRETLLDQQREAPVAKLRTDTVSTLDGFKIVDCAATSRRRSASRNPRLVPVTKGLTTNITQISKTLERS